VSGASDRFPRRLRLRRRGEFLRVQTRGRKHHTRNFLVFVAPRESCEASDLLPTRLGITVTRKVGNAVERNHIKRLVREVFRRNHRRLAPGLDLVWVAKRTAKDLSLEQVQGDLTQLLRVPGLAKEASA
jgi:ribonuclease P protein component